MDVGLKLTVTPPPCPVADNAIAELKAPEIAVVMVDLPLPPRVTETDVGAAEIVKSDFTAVTVRETVAICVAVPPFPVIVIVYGPAVAFAATVIVIVDVPAPVMDIGLKLTVTPVGCPVANKVIVELNPPETVVVMVDVPPLPCATETAVGEADSVKSADVEAPVRALASPAPGLPQPVTRS